MISIDCAYDEKIAYQLTQYLNGIHYDAKQEQSIVLVNNKVPENILRTFLSEIKKSEYSVTAFGADTLILSKKLSVKDMQCEVFGDILEQQRIV